MKLINADYLTGRIFTEADLTNAHTCYESIMAIINGSATVAIMLVVGFVLFWLSDIVLMNIYFGNKTDKQKVNYYYFNLAFYYGAQILIALSLWFI